MEKIHQQSKKPKVTFDNKSRESYFKTFQQALKNLALVDKLNTAKSLKLNLHFKKKIGLKISSES